MARITEHPSHDAVARFGSTTRDVATCRVCGRTLLMGERSVGFFTVRGEGPFDVCELCVPRAGKFGLRAKPSTPDELARTKQHRGIRSLVARISDGLGSMPSMRRRRSGDDPGGYGLKTAPVGAAAVPLALASFNAGEHARMLAGLSRTLGRPRASVVPRSPTDREVILTVAWDIVWYQFRIMPDGTIEDDRGTYLADLPARWQTWNCIVLPSGKVAPQSTEPATSDPSGRLTP